MLPATGVAPTTLLSLPGTTTAATTTTTTICTCQGTVTDSLSVVDVVNTVGKWLHERIKHIESKLFEFKRKN